MYMYIFSPFSINKNAASFTSKSKEKEVHIIYKTGEEHNIIKG